MDVLKAMIDFGCYFTIGVEVLYSDYIKEIAKAVPDHLLLTETDNPGALKWLKKNDEIGMPVAIKRRGQRAGNFASSETGENRIASAYQFLPAYRQRSVAQKRPRATQPLTSKHSS